MVKSILLLALAAVSAVQAFDNRIFLIRHGEKVDDDTPGLSTQGQQRAQCLVNVFSNSNGYNIGSILTQQYNSDGSRNRPYLTAKPLADSLKLTIDHSCDRDDADCAADKVKSFADKSTKDVLIVWEHDALEDIGKALGSKKIDYPSSRFDLIYEIVHKALASGYPISEHCPGLDS